MGTVQTLLPKDFAEKLSKGKARAGGDIVSKRIWVCVFSGF